VILTVIPMISTIAVISLAKLLFLKVIHATYYDGKMALKISSHASVVKCYDFKS